MICVTRQSVRVSPSFHARPRLTRFALSSPVRSVVRFLCEGGRTRRRHQRISVYIYIASVIRLHQRTFRFPVCFNPGRGEESNRSCLREPRNPWGAFRRGRSSCPAASTRALPASVWPGPGRQRTRASLDTFCKTRDCFRSGGKKTTTGKIK